MKIYTNQANDRAGIRQGEIAVNSWNVSPVTVTATAAGRALTPLEIDQYDFFNAAQTSASTDSIVLPNSLPVGTEIRIQTASAISIQCPSGSSVLLNNVAAPAKGALAANCTAVLVKVSSTRIIFNQISTLGAWTQPIPA